MSLQLNDLKFQDLYIRLDDGATEDTQSRYHIKPAMGEPRQPGNFPVPEEFNARIDVLRGHLREQKKDNCSVEFDGVRMRVVRYPTVKDQVWSSLRRIGDKPPRLNELHFQPGIIETITGWGNNEGLVIIGGSTGSGKTTTAIAMINEFMDVYGGTLYTIEDPVEYILQGELGKNGNGFVIQREVQEDSEWAQCIKDALRSAPKYIFVGEVRDGAAAKQLLRAATSGHLAICTVHGSSVVESLSAMLQNARSELGSMGANLLAQGLTAVLWQEIRDGRPNVKILDATDPESTGVRSLIRDDKMNQLKNDIQLQENRRIKKYGGQPSFDKTSSRGSVSASGDRPKTSRPPAPPRPAPRPPKPVSDKDSEGSGGKKSGGLFGGWRK